MFHMFSMWGSSGFSGFKVFPKTSLCVCVWLPIQGLFPCHTQFSQDRLRIHRHPNRDKALTENEWLSNKAIIFLFYSRSFFNVFIFQVIQKHDPTLIHALLPAAEERTLSLLHNNAPHSGLFSWRLSSTFGGNFSFLLSRTHRWPAGPWSGLYF